MAKMTIIEGNSNDKDNVRALMVKGEAGQDGVSPTASVSKTGKVSTLTVTDATGTTSTTINDGEDGQDGQDGYSPTATVTKLNSVATISITDKNGTTTANVSDGAAGYEIPANGVIGWDSNDTIPSGYEEIPEQFKIVTATASNIEVPANDISSAISLTPTIPTGYKIFALKSYAVTGSGSGGAVFARGFDIDANSTLYGTYLYNPTNSAKTWTVTANIILIYEGV